MKKLKEVLNGDITGFIVFAGICYAIYLTVKFIVVSNNLW